MVFSWDFYFNAVAEDDETSPSVEVTVSKLPVALILQKLDSTEVLSLEQPAHLDQIASGFFVFG